MYITATIPASGTTSAWIPTSSFGSIDSERLAIVGIYAPTGASQTSCAIQGSFAGGADAGFDVLDSVGIAKTFPVAANKLTDIPPAMNPMALPPYIRVKLPAPAAAEYEYKIGLRLV
jgi:hypothetical protein